MPKKAKTSGRPPVLTDSDTVYVDGLNAKTILQSASDRRAIVNRLVEFGGRALVSELNGAFGFDTRPQLLALMREGWLASTAKKPPMPRRTKSMLAE